MSACTQGGARLVTCLDSGRRVGPGPLSSGDKCLLKWLRQIKRMKMSQQMTTHVGQPNFTDSFGCFHGTFNVLGKQNKRLAISYLSKF